MEDRLRPHALRLWDYMNIANVNQAADIIIAFGTSDNGLAVRSAELYKQGLAPRILFSGHKGERSSSVQSEAQIYKDIAVEHGVPERDIFLETRSTNSEENTKFTYQLVQKERLPVDSIILVQKPVSLRRFRATFRKFWPNKETKLQMSCQQTTPDEYLLESPEGQQHINQMMADLQRLHVYAEDNYRQYPELFRKKDWDHINETDGFSVTEKIPAEVWTSWEILKNAGYNKLLIEKYQDHT